jgi:hypothetical protein
MIKIYVAGVFSIFVFFSLSCEKKQDTKFSGISQRDGEFDTLITKSRSGDADAILTLFRMSSKYKIKEIQQDEIIGMMRKLADAGNTEACGQIFRYFFKNPAERPDDWRDFIYSSFKGGNIQAGFTILILDRFTADPNFSFSDSDLSAAKLIITETETVDNDFRSGNLTVHDFSVVFEFPEDSNSWKADSSLDSLSEEALGIINHYTQSK